MTAPMACCRSCGEPLVFTVERPGYEFVCVPCDRWYGFLDPVGKEPTMELDARLEDQTLRYEAQRAERERVAGEGR
jgi:hypothetical protein